MSIGQHSTGGPALVPGAHRVIRILDTDEGPYRGVLVASAGTVAVLTDSAALTGWTGWRLAGAEHVAAPVDVVRRGDGLDALLPWCTERVGVFMGRRHAAGEALSAGESATLVASVLRGLDELGAAGELDATGDWWLTDRGRPVFALGEGSSSCHRSSAIIEEVADACGDRALTRLLRSIAQGVVEASGRPRLPRLRLDEWERQLMEVAAPRPLRMDVHSPERARDIEIVRSRASVQPPLTRRGVREDAAAAVSSRAGKGVETRVHSLLRVLRLHAQELMEFALVARWRGRAHLRSRQGDGREEERVFRHRRGRDGRAAGGRAKTDESPGSNGTAGRRRSLMVAGVAAALVIVGGLLWPSTEESPRRSASASDASESSSPPSDEPDETVGAQERGSAPGDAAGAGGDTGSRSDAPRTTPVPDDDPVKAAATLITRLRECAQAGDDTCAQTTVDAASRFVAELGRDADRVDASELSLVDAYGDVAVIRWTPRATTSGDQDGPVARMVVLERRDAKWLVRDAYDVADQPG